MSSVRSLGGFPVILSIVCGGLNVAQSAQMSAEASLHLTEIVSVANMLRRSGFVTNARIEVDLENAFERPAR